MFKLVARTLTLSSAGLIALGAMAPQAMAAGSTGAASSGADLQVSVVNAGAYTPDLVFVNIVIKNNGPVAAQNVTTIQICGVPIQSFGEPSTGTAHIVIFKDAVIPAGATQVHHLIANYVHIQGDQQNPNNITGVFSSTADPNLRNNFVGLSTLGTLPSTP